MLGVFCHGEQYVDPFMSPNADRVPYILTPHHVPPQLNLCGRCKGSTTLLSLACSRLSAVTKRIAAATAGTWYADDVCQRLLMNMHQRRLKHPCPALPLAHCL
jgi:hypothetical protein